MIRALRQFPLDNGLLSYVVEQDAAGARQAAAALSGGIHATLSGGRSEFGRITRLQLLFMQRKLRILHRSSTEVFHLPHSRTLSNHPQSTR